MGRRGAAVICSGVLIAVLVVAVAITQAIYVACGVAVAVEATAGGCR